MLNPLTTWIKKPQAPLQESSNTGFEQPDSKQADYCPDLSFSFPTHNIMSAQDKSPDQSDLLPAISLLSPKCRSISQCATSMTKLCILTKALRRKAPAKHRMAKMGQWVYRGGRKIARELVKQQLSSLQNGEAQTCSLNSQQELIRQKLAKEYPEYRRVFMVISLLVKLSPAKFDLSNDRSELMEFAVSMIKHLTS
jgi:hypothetical protein